jgi:hypothetical protein
MLSPMTSTGRKKGAASFCFFNDRIVDWQNRNCAMLRFDGPAGELDDGGVSTVSTIDIAADEGGGEAADVGGGVADLRDAAKGGRNEHACNDEEKNVSLRA